MQHSFPLNVLACISMTLFCITTQFSAVAQIDLAHAVSNYDQASSDAQKAGYARSAAVYALTESTRPVAIEWANTAEKHALASKDLNIINKVLGAWRDVAIRGISSYDPTIDSLQTILDTGNAIHLDHRIRINWILLWIYQNKIADNVRGYILVKRLEELVESNPGNLMGQAIQPSIYSQIGWILNHQGDQAAALIYTKKSILHFRARGLDNAARYAMMQQAEIVYFQGDFEEGKRLLQSVIEESSLVGDQNTMKRVHEIMAGLLLSEGHYVGALSHALHSLDESAPMSQRAFRQVRAAQCYMAVEKPDSALHHALIGLNLGEQHGLEKELLDAYEVLKDIYHDLGDYENAYTYYTLFDQFKSDQLSFARAMEISAFNDELQQEQQTLKDKISDQELLWQRNLRNAFLVAFLAGILVLVIVIRQRNKISQARKRSDELLLNILPRETSEELKASGTVAAKHYDIVTVLFTDLKGFTEFAAKESPQVVVGLLNECFSTFDIIANKYGIEKIKTIGDAYMAAGGLPAINDTHAIDVVGAGLAMQSAMAAFNEKHQEYGNEVFKLRIGVHSGPVVAGIVGIKKFQYDIWGDTVNTASRMESAGVPGKVNISRTTYELVKDSFSCESRGKISVKGKGDLEMFFAGINAA